MNAMQPGWTPAGILGPALVNGIRERVIAGAAVPARAYMRRCT